MSEERFLPEYRDLLRRNIFDKVRAAVCYPSRIGIDTPIRPQDEISDIVRQRKGFERSLASRDVKPADYLRYIEYETRLEKLRKLRASRISASF